MNKIKIYWDIISPTMGIIVMGIGVFLGVGLFLSIPLCLLWNWLMPTIFGLPTLNLLEAFGLSVLVTLLSPRKIDLTKKKDIDTTPDTKLNDDLNEKLEKVFQDITSQFKA